MPPTVGFGTLSYGASCIYITGSRNMVQNCNFNFSFARTSSTVAPPDVYAIWVSSTNAQYNRITNNNTTTVGIHYAEYGSSYAFCDGNYIVNASTDGLQGTGNDGGSNPCQGNIVSNNIVIGAGYSGIEDQQYIDGTIISHNVILQSGQALYAPTAGQGMGISAVGTNTQIIGNIIGGVVNGTLLTPFLNYAIEVFGAGGIQVEDNIITDTAQSYSGIFINHYNAPVSPSSPYPGRLNATNVVNNNITGCTNCIQAEADNNVYLNIHGNKTKDFSNRGIYLQTDCTEASVNITNNTIILTEPNTVGGIRTGINTFTNYPTTQNGFIRISNNNISYESGVGTTGTGTEIAILPGHAGILIEGNVVNANSVYTVGPTDISTFGTNGGIVDSAKYVNNKSFGTYASVDLSTFTNMIQIGNNWTNGATEVLFDIIITAPNAACTIASAGLLVKLPVITTGRVVTLPSAANYVGGTVKIWNQNTAAFNWTFSGIVKSAANATITTLTNSTWYILVSDGTYWNKTN